MEPALPAPPDELMPADELADTLELAQVADGALPRFHQEQRPPKTDAQIKAEENAARTARGKAVSARQDAGETLSDEAFADMCFYFDPVGNARRRRRPR